jgi:hypothetical protein
MGVSAETLFDEDLELLLLLGLLRGTSFLLTIFWDTSGSACCSVFAMIGAGLI